MDKTTELTLLEKELCSFYEFCKENNFSPEEMQQILSPLHHIIKKTKLYRYTKYLTIFISILFFGYYFLQFETISWHISAVGRIAMVQILPFWNWQSLFSEKCLIYGMKQAKRNLNFDCTLCESIDSVPIETNLDPDALNEMYLDINVPVIILDGLKNWPTQNIGYNISDSILKNYILSKSYPCEMSNNFLTSSTDISTAIKRSSKFKKWFLHFQNCELDAVKGFRVIAPRPYFLKPEISPIQYSWVLMSKNYNAPNFKSINLREKIAIVAQIHGSNHVRLTPRRNCLDNCPIIEAILQKNEALVFGPLWNFEYKPNEDTNNIAVILETN